jgi:CRISPR/Cas system CSM-associated protein Csm2 small subunit
MKQFISPFILFLFLFGCKDAVKTKQYHFSQLGWTINVPADLEIMDAAQIEKLNEKGRAAIEKTLDTAVDFSATKTLISITKNKLNNFTATITPFNVTEDGNWAEQNESLKLIMMETFKTQAPGAAMDTSSATESINGVSFQVFKTKLALPNNINLVTLMYSKLYKEFDFGVTITYVDAKTGKQLQDILSSSSFKK